MGEPRTDTATKNIEHMRGPAASMPQPKTNPNNTQLPFRLWSTSRPPVIINHRWAAPRGHMGGPRADMAVDPTAPPGPAPSAPPPPRGGPPEPGGAPGGESPGGSAGAPGGQLQGEKKRKASEGLSAVPAGGEGAAGASGAAPHDAGAKRARAEGPGSPGSSGSPPPGPAKGGAAKKKKKASAPKEEEDELEDDRAMKIRLMRFKPIKAGQKCGFCKHCKNPRSHKACITVREQQIKEQLAQEADQEAHETLRRLVQGKYANKKSQTIERQLNAILEDDATIKKAEHIPKFVKLMQGPRSIMVKGVLLNVLNASAKHPALLEGFAVSTGVKILRLWLVDARDTDNKKLSKLMMEFLAKVPLSFDMLQKSRIGKVVKQLSKVTPHDDIKKQSKALMATWMDVIKKSAEEEKRYVGTHSLPGHARGRVSLMIVHSNHSILRFILSIVLRNQTHPANLRPRLGARPSRRAGAGRELTRGAGAGRPS